MHWMMNTKRKKERKKITETTTEALRRKENDTTPQPLTAHRRKHLLFIIIIIFFSSTESTECHKPFTTNCAKLRLSACISNVDVVAFCMSATSAVFFFFSFIRPPALVYCLTYMVFIFRMPFVSITSLVLIHTLARAHVL